jgi:hypothetical protein
VFGDCCSSTVLVNKTAPADVHPIGVKPSVGKVDDDVDDVDDVDAPDATTDASVAALPRGKSGTLQPSSPPKVV